jgi:formylglycine-generating enzyme required for sulfatase activity
VAGSLPDGASYYGVLDMAGNVWEWVNNPQIENLVRGGSFAYGAFYLRSAFRYGYGPGAYSNYMVGFRCVFVQL